MTESLLSLEKSVIFREVFNSAYDVASNRYARGTISATGVQFQNGVAKLRGGTITYPQLIKSYPYTIIIKCIYYSSGDYAPLVKQVNGTKSNQIQLNPSLDRIIAYNNDQAYTPPIINQSNSPGNSFSNNLGKSVIIGMQCLSSTTESVFNYGSKGLSYQTGTVTATSFAKSSLVIGHSTLSVDIESIEIYNRALSTSEIKLLYQQRLYQPSQELPLLLDFDSTRNVLEDKTGRNILTPTGVTTQRIGKVYSAYFNGSSSVINTNYSHKGNVPFCITAWVYPIRNSLFYIIWNTYTGTSPGFDLYISAAGYVGVGDGNGTNSNNNILSSTTKLKLFNPYHISLICSLSNFTSIYVNGIKQVVSGVVHPGYSGNAQQNVAIGYSTHIGRIFKTQIYQGIPSNPSDWAAQKYVSEKGAFGI